MSHPPKKLIPTLARAGLELLNGEKYWKKDQKRTGTASRRGSQNWALLCKFLIDWNAKDQLCNCVWGQAAYLFQKECQSLCFVPLTFLLLIYSFKEYSGRAWTRLRTEIFQKISLRPGRLVFLFSFHKLFHILDKIISLLFSSTSIQVLRKHLFRFPDPLLQLLLYSSSLGLQ